MILKSCMLLGLSLSLAAPIYAQGAEAGLPGKGAVAPS